MLNLTCRDFIDLPVLVVGDCMLDRYLHGRVQRISAEAPAPVVTLGRQWTSPGGAGHVCASLAGLGCRVTLAAAIGRDPDGVELTATLEKAGVTELLIAGDQQTRTISKTRVLAGTHQQLLRLDVDGSPAEFERLTLAIAEQVMPRLASFKAVVLADYDKGTLSVELLRSIIDECRRLSIPCVVDPKKRDFDAYRGATILTPNTHEAERALGRALSDNASVEAAALELRSRLALDYMLITRGAEGMTLAARDVATHIPAKVRAVADVTGAGDTVVATMAACLAAGGEISEACRMAGLAAGIAVSMPGTYVVKAAELDTACQGLSPKIVDWDTARARAADAQRSARKVVFTNGCFDILHAGHLHCLEQARGLGDLLVVGLNSDSSVKLNKGPTRPVIREELRASLLAGLGCVDLIVLFDELTPENLVRHVAPDVLAKGGDYDPATMAGADFVRARGGHVVTIPLVDGLSTTNILRATAGNDARSN